MGAPIQWKWKKPYGGLRVFMVGVFPQKEIYKNIYGYALCSAALAFISRLIPPKGLMSSLICQCEWMDGSADILVRLLAYGLLSMIMGLVSFSSACCRVRKHTSSKRQTASRPIMV